MRPIGCTKGVVSSSIVLHLHVSYDCYNGICRLLYFTRAKHFLASYVVEHTFRHYDIFEIRHMPISDKIV